MTAAPARAGPPLARSSPTGIPVWLAYPAGHAGRLAPAGCFAAPREFGRDHRDRQGVRIPGAVHQHSGLPGRHQAGRRDEGGESEAEDRLRRTARHHAAGEVAATKARRSTSSCAASSISRPWNTPTASRSKRFPASRYRGPNGKVVHNPDRPAIAESRRDARRGRRLQARPRHHALQRSVPALSVRLAVHHPRLPGAVHFLPVAADAQRTSVAQALHRCRRARDGEGQRILGRG